MTLTRLGPIAVHSACRKLSHAKKGKTKLVQVVLLSFNEDIDMKLCQWILEMRDLHLPVQQKHIQRKAMALIQPTHSQVSRLQLGGWKSFSSDIPSLYAGKHPFSRSCQQTSIQQKLPAQLDEKLSSFLCEIKANELIINMDETPVYFDMGANSTIEKLGKKEVVIRGTGAHKWCFTVTLICTTAEQML